MSNLVTLWTPCLFVVSVSSGSVATVEPAGGHVPVLPVRPGALGQREHIHTDRDRDRSSPGHPQSAQVGHVLAIIADRSTQHRPGGGRSLLLLFFFFLTFDFDFFVLTRTRVVRCSATPSKFRAKMSIAAIWAVAFALATPMAVALRVQYIEYGDGGQWHTIFACGLVALVGIETHTSGWDPETIFPPPPRSYDVHLACWSPRVRFELARTANGRLRSGTVRRTPCWTRSSATDRQSVNFETTVFFLFSTDGNKPKTFDFIWRNLVPVRGKCFARKSFAKCSCTEILSSRIRSGHDVFMYRIYRSSVHDSISVWMRGYVVRSFVYTRSSFKRGTMWIFVRAHRKQKNTNY